MNIRGTFRLWKTMTDYGLSEMKLGFGMIWDSLRGK